MLFCWEKSKLGFAYQPYQHTKTNFRRARAAPRQCKVFVAKTIRRILGIVGNSQSWQFLSLHWSLVDHWTWWTAHNRPLDAHNQYSFSLSLSHFVPLFSWCGCSFPCSGISWSISRQATTTCSLRPTVQPWLLFPFAGLIAGSSGTSPVLLTSSFRSGFWSSSQSQGWFMKHSGQVTAQVVKKGDDRRTLGVGKWREDTGRTVSVEIKPRI